MKSIVCSLLFLSFISISFAQEPFFPQFNKDSKTWHYLDVNGKNVLEIKIPFIQEIHPFYDGLAAVKDSSKQLWGYINTKGDWQIKPQFDIADDFLDGYAITFLLCKKDCITVSEGIQTTHNGQIIDKKGNVVLKDRAQLKNDTERYFFDKNIGKGLFVISYGFGFGDEKGVLDLKGNEVCSSGGVFGPKGPMIFDEELNAVRCGNVFYSPMGELLLDLSIYGYLHPFKNGQTWGMREEKSNADAFEDSDDSSIFEDYIVYHVLLSDIGEEILRIELDSISDPEPVVNGKFRYKGNDSKFYEYDLETGNSILLSDEQTYNSKISFGSPLSNGCQLIYTTDSSETLIGFRNKNGQEFYK